MNYAKIAGELIADDIATWERDGGAWRKMEPDDCFAGFIANYLQTELRLTREDALLLAAEYGKQLLRRIQAERAKSKAE